MIVYRKNMIKKYYDDEILHRIEMLYDKMIWLAKDNKEVSVLDMSEKYFNSVLKMMRNKYGIRFNLYEKEQRLRRVRKDYLLSIKNC